MANESTTNTAGVEMTSMDMQFQSHGVSLPAPEDYDPARKRKPGKRVILVAAGAAVCIIAVAIIGTVVGITQTNNKSSRSSAISANAPPEATIVEWLVERNVSSRAALEDTLSPQHRAMQWLRMRDDPVPPRSPSPTASLNDQASYMYAASYVLAVLFYSTNGEKWPYDVDFLKFDDICEWTDDSPGFDENGVSLEPSGILCDISSNIPTVLDIEWNELVGSIPTELGLLTTLQRLDLSYNGLTGALPTELCQLTNLFHLEIGRNFFTGGLPSCITELTNLVELNAPVCGLSGPLSEEVLCQMNKLQVIFLMYNDFTGSIPKCDGQDWPDLITLQLSDNQLTGQLPTELATFPFLSELYVDGNDLSGNPLETVNKLVGLTVLYLEDNSFTGTLDSTFASNLLGILALDLSNNQFVGTVASELFTLPDLVVLDLSSNMLNGRLPDQIAVNDDFRFLSLYKNQITGPVPSALTNLRFMEHVDISNNLLTGELNPDVFAIPTLRNIFMSENPGFTQGTVPEMIGMVNLREISLKNTNRVGSLPTFEDSTFIHLIDLDNNALTGPVPSNYGSFTNLGYLLLNRNPGLNGNMPTFTEPSVLNTVLVDKTSITGDFNSICDLPTFLGMIDVYEGIDPVILADCGDADSGITCRCCKCCAKSQTCSEPTVDSLNWTWETLFGSVARDFGVDHTLFPDSTSR